MSTKKILSGFIAAALVAICFILLFPWITSWAFYLYTQHGSCNQTFITPILNHDVVAVKSSLDKGKNPNCVDMRDFTNARTPLSIAAIKDNGEIVNILIDAGAKPEKTLMGHYSAGVTPASEILIKRAKLNQEELDILLVSYSKSPNMMRHLIDKGAHVNASISPKGWIKKHTSTPLYQAAYNTGQSQYSYPEGLKFLLDNGANPNLPGAGGNLPLSAAAENRNPEIIRALIKAGADINRATECGFPPLIIAAAKGFPNNLKILLDAGSDVNTADNRNRTNDDCLRGDQLMVQARAQRLDQKTADHRRQIMGIQDEANQKRALKHQKNPEKAAYSANRSIDGPYNGTALMWAAYSCNSESVSLLLKKGANVHARDAYGATALMWAYACDAKAYKKVTLLLLAAGADLKAEDMGGKTAKDYLSKLQ